ncbi:MAG: hypothetical protein JRF17_06170 [Deltaproteobacteria bacterium]|nr:hypothetical protein [Deltaproteobacteria bacterium]
MNIVKLNIRWSLNFMFMIISKIQFVTDGMLMEVRVDNRERLALAEKVQKDIQKRTLNYRLIRRREKIEREFKKMLQNKWSK